MEVSVVKLGLWGVAATWADAVKGTAKAAAAIRTMLDRNNETR